MGIARIKRKVNNFEGAIKAFKLKATIRGNSGGDKQ